MLHESTERALALNPEHLRAVAALMLRDALERFFREVRDIAREYDDTAMA